MSTAEVIVIGGGYAGHRVAQRLSRGGRFVTLLEQSGRIVGRVDDRMNIRLGFRIGAIFKGISELFIVENEDGEQEHGRAIVVAASVVFPAIPGIFMVEAYQVEKLVNRYLDALGYTQYDMPVVDIAH